MGNVEVRVRSKDYADWKSIEVVSDLDQIADTITCVAGPGIGPRVLPARCPVTVRDDGRLLFTGRFELPTFGWAARSVEYSGRSKTGDLDSSAEPGQYRNITLAQLAAQLCYPHGIKVLTNADDEGPVLKNVIIEPSESIVDILRREGAVPGYLWVPDRSGNLVMLRPGRVLAADVLEPPNVEDMRLSVDGQQLWGMIQVQAAQVWDDSTYGTNANATAEVRDPKTRSSRRLIIKPARPLTPEQARDRGLWEMATRKAKAITLTIDLADWKQSNGKPWEPGLKTRCRNDWMDLDCDMIVSRVTRKKGAEDKVACTLECKPPEAYLPEDPTHHKVKRHKRGKARPESWEESDGEGDDE